MTQLLNQTAQSGYESTLLNEITNLNNYKEEKMYIYLPTKYS